MVANAENPGFANVNEISLENSAKEEEEEKYGHQVDTIPVTNEQTNEKKTPPKKLTNNSWKIRYLLKRHYLFKISLRW